MPQRLDTMSRRAVVRRLHDKYSLYSPDLDSRTVVNPLVTTHRLLVDIAISIYS